MERLKTFYNQEKPNKSLENLCGSLNSYNVLENVKYDELSDFKIHLDKKAAEKF